ncbi:MAG: chemotaxis protein CheB [Gemmatimonadales bacterium]|nr:chemotaxis protein CheB [Gemmatimonadales bacterium]
MKRKQAAAPAVVIPPDDEPGGAKSAPASMVEAAVPRARAFPIVGIGASAGGLGAFELFFRAMPADPGVDMAFVLVQHLAPDHPSILTELIARFTSMPVFEVQDGMMVKPNCVYVIPPNRDLALLNGALHLLEPATPRHQRLAIDFCFRSLAQDQREKAIGIILSGTGSDGSLGVRAIKGEGGMVMAQTPSTTEFDGMPRAAVATGVVDFVLPPEDMPGELIAFVEHAFGRSNGTTGRPEVSTDDALKRVFGLLLAHTGHDFSRYKQSTIARRVERRMAVHRVEAVAAYVRILQRDPGEIDALFRDLLIGVTSFFRDPEAFDVLEAQAIPRIFAGKSVDDAVRVWVPGCSTGEEAYSIAMLLIEYMEATKQSFKLQVFATDIDRRAIDTARAGIYPVSIAADVPAARLSRFFVLEQDGLHVRIQKRVRDALIFSEQNVVRDPPFSRVDLISCRNLLIYMDGELQKRLMPLFDYALNPGGFLFLGTSETVGEFGTLFSTVDRKAKLYQSRDDGHVRAATAARFRPAQGEAERTPRTTKVVVPTHGAQLRELTERSLLQHRSLAAALVNHRGDILYLHGRSGKYLELAAGEAETNILKMAREGLGRPLSVALRRAVTRNERVHHAGLSVKTNGDFTTVDLTVQPVEGEEAEAQARESRRYLVTLEDAGTPSLPEVVPTVSVVDDGQPVDARIVALERELRRKEENLQMSNEELETSNEELKSSNEEMQSVNEELQSANEEMETSKEELQSVNEELSTVNVELQSRVADLSEANNDMNNLLAGTGVGTIFVGHALEIKRFTPAVTHLINLIPSDVGRSVGHIVANLRNYDRLVEDVQSVLDTLVPVEREVQSKEGRWFLMRIRPYRTLENVIEGAVITFADVTNVKEAQAALVESQALVRLAVVLRDATDAITVRDLEGRITAWNPGASRMYGWTEAEALGMNIRELVPEHLREASLETVRQLTRARELAPFRTQRVAKNGETVEITLTATALVNEAGEMYAIATTERAIT